MEHNEFFAAKLTAIIAVIFGLQNIFPWITDLFVLNSTLIILAPWTLVTSIFLHGSFEHILFNGFALLLFGSILEHVVGTKKFLAIFFITGIFAGIVFILGIPIVAAVQGSSAVSALGASGAIFGVIGVLAVLRPNLIVYLGFFPMPMWVAAIIWAFQDLFGVFIPDNTANFAHLGGMFLGILIGLYLNNWKINLGKKRGFSKVLTEGQMQMWESQWMRIE